MKKFLPDLATLCLTFQFTVASGLVLWADVMRKEAVNAGSAAASISTTFRLPPRSFSISSINGEMVRHGGHCSVICRDDVDFNQIIPTNRLLSTV